MSLIIIILILFLFFGGFGIYGTRAGWYSSGAYGGSSIGLVILILLILWLAGYIH